ncbi:hypothetical protein CMI47_12780 [Candidatus Pacearchaeota archaeon]|nr:hypothetical protein [Candidatus Pacearchaeota archaeon]|tara:strand:+ start:57217 stop:57561 length:345 start_codon:yes stop_codon:yes gene_type:complete
MKNDVYQLKEARKKERHYPWQIWKTARGNFRAQDNKGRQRSFKTYAEARAWLDAIKVKDKELHTLKVKGITPKTELRKVIGYIRAQLAQADELVDHKKVLRKSLNALSKIHVKM